LNIFFIGSSSLHAVDSAMYSASVMDRVISD
jgi:hypothetical protein